MSDSNNYTERQMLNAVRAIQMIANLKGARIEDKYTVLDDICGDSYYWDALIDWAVRVMTTDEYMTPSMKINYAMRIYEQQEEEEATK